jgi:hypothetical protein
MNLNEKSTGVIMTNIRVLSGFVLVFTFVYCSHFVNYTLHLLDTYKNDIFLVFFCVLFGIYSLNNTFLKYKVTRDLMSREVI